MNILDSQEFQSFDESKYEELFPHGLVAGLMQPKPMLLLKNETETLVLPIWLNNVEGQSLANYLQSQKEENSGHDLSLSLFDEIGLDILRFVFVDVDKENQWFEMHYSFGKKQYKKKLSADSSINFAFATEAPIFATEEFVRANRHFNALPDLLGLENSLTKLDSQQTYLM